MTLSVRRDTEDVEEAEINRYEEENFVRLDQRRKELARKKVRLGRFIAAVNAHRPKSLAEALAFRKNSPILATSQPLRS